VRARIVSGKDPREILEWFDVIPAEVDRLDAILTGYLSLARPEAEGEGECRPAEVAAETARLLGPELERRGIRLELDTAAAGVLPAAMGGRSLKQVLLNLLLNASQAMDSGGEISVRVRPDGSWIMIEVEDGGCGMSEADRRRALEPFFTTKPTGSGLGLTLVHSLVQAREGRLDIRSTPGQGTRVTVRLPRGGKKEGSR
jgi:signal transduction histidine kinase